MENLGSFISMDRRQAMAKGRTLSDRSRGTTLFADISGFTPLTEALVEKYGAQRGVEELTASLNRVYNAFIAQVHQFGGSVIAFSGDAITCWFEDDTARAAAASLAMQAAMEEVGNIQISASETIRLTVKIAISHGWVRRFQVGDPSHYFIDVIAGEPISRLAEIQEYTPRGQVLTDVETTRALGEKVRTKPLSFDGREYALVQSLAGEVAPLPWPPLASDAITNEQARPWIIPIVYDRLAAGQGEFLSELRNANAIFCKFEGVDYENDPQAGEKLDAYIRWVQQIAGRYGGELLSVTIGDKGSYLYINVGALVAHDDDVLRALAIAMELQSVPESLAFIRNVQIGVSRGRVRTGAYGSESQRVYGALGDEINVAARLMEHAQGGQIVVSERIVQISRHRYEFRPLGSTRIKGKTGDFNLFELAARHAEASAHERRLSKMIGRERERGQLSAVLERLAKTRQGGLLIIQGEAGIGKSRLIQDMADQAAGAGVSAIMGAADAIEQAVLYFAWRSIFAHLFQINALPADMEARRVHALAWLNEHISDPDLLKLFPLLSAVLQVDIPDNEATIILGGHERAEVTRELLARILEQAARRAPLAVIIEDAHWLDSSSWALAQRVSTKAPSLLLVLATRPMGEEAPPEFTAIQSAPFTTNLHIGPLASDDVALLLRERLQVDSLPQSVIEFVWTKSEGNPFFSEELIHALRDTGVLAISGRDCALAPNAPALTDLNFPDTVEGVITSRIDLLSPSQQLAIKVASVIGRTFSYQILSQVHPTPEELATLDADLKTVARLDLTPLYEPEPELRYMFKHVITQEVSYGLLLFVQRQRLHRAVGEWYEGNYSADLAPYYPLLAHHWTRTVQSPPYEPDALQKAIDYSLKAGEQALRNDALVESLGHFTKALELIETLPESPQRDGMELHAQVLRAVPLMLTRGWANPDVGRAYERARELTRRLGESPQMFLALVGVFTYYLVRGNFRQAGEIGDVNYAVAQKSEDPELILEASQDRGAAHFYMGQLEECMPHFARVSDLYISEKHHYHVFAYGRNPLAVALQHEALAHWYLGFPEKALERNNAAMRLTEQWHHPFSRAWVLISRCLLLQLRGEIAEMQATAREAIELAVSQGFPNWLAQGFVYLGWGMTARGDAEQGLAKIQEGLGIWRMTGAVLATPVFLYLLAEARHRAGQIEEARAVVNEALTLINQTEERLWEPELHRLNGDLYLPDSPSEAEGHFLRALEQARRQRARSNELRTAMSLAQLWHARGKTQAARDLLQPVYAAFTEGFGTRDLTQAREFLHVLQKE